jgi:hypothetical protein
VLFLQFKNVAVRGLVPLKWKLRKTLAEEGMDNERVAGAERQLNGTFKKVIGYAIGDEELECEAKPKRSDVRFGMWAVAANAQSKRSWNRRVLPRTFESTYFR